MPRMPAIEREEKTARVVDLSAKGWTDSDIGIELGIDRRTVKKLREDEYAVRAEHRAQDKEAAIAVYTKLIREGWDRLEKLDSRSLNVSGILNSIRQAQERIDKLTGAEAPIKVQDVDEDYEVVWDDDERTAEASS